MQLTQISGLYADFLLMVENIAGKHGVAFFAAAPGSFSVTVIFGDTALQWQGTVEPSTFLTDFPGAIQLSSMFGVLG